MRSAVILFPGTNRERDAARALAEITGAKPVIVWHRETSLPPLDLIVVPGGFSYGDYLRTGAIAAHSPVMRAVAAAAGAGVHVLGICNGFQILAEAGLLPGVLQRNRTLKFICRDVHVRAETAASAFTRAIPPGSVLRVPVAHADGNYFCDPETLARLRDEDRIAFRYCAPDGSLNDAGNVNGSVDSIAGILDESRRVLGLMPHPENAIDPLLGSVDGRGMFESLAAAFA